MVILIALLVFICATLGISYQTHMCIFRSEYVYPGDVYDGSYQVPPTLKIDGGRCPILHASYLEEMRVIFRQIVHVLESEGITYYASGGTLLAITRHNCLNIMDDDDMDIHCSWDHVEKLLSQEVKAKFRACGIDMLQITKWDENSRHITPLNMCLRFRRTGTASPMVDVFFFDHVDNTIQKIECINNYKKEYNKTERWPTSFVMPLRRILCDETEVMVPCKAVDVLRKQYGNEVMERKPQFSMLQCHNLPHTVCKILHLYRVCN